jgi:monoterpene epsilon-lactone hydrolase
VSGDVRVEVGPVGLVVRPPQESATVLLHLPHDRGASLALDARPGAGGPRSAGGVAEHLALATGATVVCTPFRAEFPDALEDALAAYELCTRMGPVVLAGERLGAGLGAALMISLRDSGAALPRCAVFVSALLDPTLQSRSVWLNAGADTTFDLTRLRRQVADYTGALPPTGAELNPLYANLHGLPPIGLLVAGTDPLLDDSLAFAARAARDRVTVDLRVSPDLAGLRADRAGFVRDLADRHGRRLPESAHLAS